MTLGPVQVKPGAAYTRSRIDKPADAVDDVDQAAAEASRGISMMMKCALSVASENSRLA